MIENIYEIVKILLEKYEFNVNTLAKYLAVPEDQIYGIINGNPENILKTHTVIDKIMFLYAITCEDPDLKTRAFLEVLIGYHHISKVTIAKMAKVKVGDVEKLFDGFADKVGTETKYKVAVTVMSLRFFLKECEPPFDE